MNLRPDFNNGLKLMKFIVFLSYSLNGFLFLPDHLKNTVFEGVRSMAQPVSKTRIALVFKADDSSSGIS